MNRKATNGSAVWMRLLMTLIGTASVVTSSGCSSLLFKVKTTPASTLPAQYRPETRNNRVPIDYRLLGQDPPDFYRLDAGDILGVVIDGVMPYSPPGSPPVPPPIHFPSADSLLPPSLGFPILVQENGKISLPALQHLDVRGLTLEETHDRIVDAYVNESILQRSDAHVTVTLLTERTYTVTVIREDLEGDASGRLIKLKAYRNDLLNALMSTGGLPGLHAKDEVVILRRKKPSAPGAIEEIEYPEIIVDGNELDICPELLFDRSVTLITLRYPRGAEAHVDPADMLLHEGDIIQIRSREAEVFYTTGLLPGGQHVLPKSYDLDVFEALSMVGYSYGALQGTGPQTGVMPTQLLIFRKVEGGDEIVIKVDLERAASEKCERLVIQPGDKLLLRYSPKEEVVNFGIYAFFSYALARILSAGSNAAAPR